MCVMDVEVNIVVIKKQYRYEALRTQQNANANLVLSRKCINLTPEEFVILDKKIKDGILNKENIYHIIISNDDIKVSVPTVYNYINQGILTITKMGLPCAVTYNKRKKSNKK